MNNIWLETLLDMLYPQMQICNFCWAEKEDISKTGICHDCQEKFMEWRQKLPVCKRCGRFTAQLECANCADWPEDLLVVTAAAPYTGIFKEKIIELKYSGKKKNSRQLGILMAQVAKKTWGKALKNKHSMLVVPVPLHELRFEERGFNQSALLAVEIARHLDLKYSEEILVRNVYEQEQKMLGRIERKEISSNVFAVCRPDKIADKNIILVDDVITTGATMLAAAKVLKQSRAKGIFGLTWAAGSDK